MGLRAPSLHLLRIFEAAARHQSFKQAAEELHLTPSAVSHQIKSLEEQLGFELFYRLNRRIELTAGGQAYFDVIASTFHKLNKGTSDVLNRFTQKRLKISLMPSLARHLLIPRLSSLRQQLSSVELVIDASSQMVDFNHSDVDLAIRYGRGNWPGLAVDQVCQMHASPMCSPSFKNLQQLQSIEDIAHAPLISYSFMTDTWLKFAEAVKLEHLSVDSGLTFNNYDIAIQAAEQGLGIAMGLIELEQAPLAQGTLIQPFDVQFPMKECLYLVYRKEDHQRPEIRTFCQWFKEQF
ncbi:transcriptional regulator GcvA [Pleionea sediminis]|uniref:transcriptional regulator GcvA n=1 Tax=Pleionea sediminis TaxID=2569479 RepID=UPI0011850397|nr:transcriptional regulator GcvA [Pleionea sediminis]